MKFYILTIGTIKFALYIFINSLYSTIPRCYGSISSVCSSCRVFFRRTSKLNHENFVCIAGYVRHDQICPINVQNRSDCKYGHNQIRISENCGNCRRCRYQKCLRVGMKSSKVRGGRWGHIPDQEETRELEILQNIPREQSRISPVGYMGTNIDRPCLLNFDDFENARKGSVEIWDSVFFDENNGDFHRSQFELCKQYKHYRFY